MTQRLSLDLFLQLPPGVGGVVGGQETKSASAAETTYVRWKLMEKRAVFFWPVHSLSGSRCCVLTLALPRAATLVL